jgi:hypothetical protein
MHITLNREHAAITLSALNSEDRDVIERVPTTTASVLPTAQSATSSK